MQLMMYINNDLIESVTLDLSSLSRPGYLGQFKRILKQKHAALISEIGGDPDFLVINAKPVYPQFTAHCAACAQPLQKAG